MKTYNKGIKTKKRERKDKINKKNKKTRYGGRAIASGSYGCVFDPAIKCANSEIPYNNKNIAKLMFTKETESELIEMAKVKKIIDRIPNKDHYFLLSNTYQCKPDKLTEEDLVTFDKKCRLFTKRNINSTNVNKEEILSSLSLIVMPNGGLNIDKIIQAILQLPEKDMYKTLIDVNKALIELLVNGIVPLTAMNFNHYDIKSGNILMSDDGHARLIDWGLSGENDGTHVPETIQDRSIAFNMPFSGIFFNNFVKKWLPTEMSKIKGSKILKNKASGQSELLKIVATNMINESIAKTSEGHFGYITSNILHDIYKIYAIKNEYNRIDYNVLSYNVLIEYIEAVLLKYVDENGNFNDVNYFYEVFTKNVDIWGFLLAYVPIIEFGAAIFHHDIINTVCRILLKYCFSPEFATKPIIVSELVMELESLTDVINERIMKSQSRKIVPIRKPSPSQIRKQLHNNKPLTIGRPMAMSMPTQTQTFGTNELSL